MTVARQRPSTANGIVFMLLEDEHGQVNLIVPPADLRAAPRDRARRAAVLARGRYERVGENRNVLVSSLESLGPLARRVGEGRHGLGVAPAPALLRPSLRPRCRERGQVWRRTRQ